jgi:hypothetical protein
MVVEDGEGQSGPKRIENREIMLYEKAQKPGFCDFKLAFRMEDGDWRGKSGRKPRESNKNEMRMRRNTCTQRLEGKL